MWNSNSSKRTNINREGDSLYLSLGELLTWSLKCGALLEKEILVLDRRQKAAIVLGGHLTVLGHILLWYYLRGSWGVFSIYGFPSKNLCVSCLLWCAYMNAVLVILSVKRSCYNASLNVEKTNKIVYLEAQETYMQDRSDTNLFYNWNWI